MTVYVDEIKTYDPRRMDAHTRRNGVRWTHMTADTKEELHEFAARLGLKRSWFQDHPTLWHYDIVPSKRALAVRLGAQEVSWRHWLVLLRQRRQNDAQDA